MVNRGWLGKQDVTVALAQDNDSVTGTLYTPKTGYTIGDAIAPGETWPKQSLYLDLAAFSTELNSALQPMVLVVAEDDVNSLVRTWQPVVVGPSRHYGYAVQWFGLALVLVIFGFIWARKLRSKQ